MPSRFLTLWSMLAKPSHQSTGNTKKKNKKDTSTSQQVHYRPGFMPVIPIYGEDITTTSGSTRSVRDEVLINEDQAPSRDRALTRPASSVFRRSLLFRKSGVPAGISKNHQSVDSLAVTREESRSVSKSQSVSGLSQRSLRVCQAKRVAPPIVPESATASSAAGQQQQQHRHSGSSFDSGGSAESSSGGYCSGTGSLSSCHAPSSSAWSQAGSDQRSSIGLDDAFLPPPPSSPVGHANNNVANKHHHMYNRGDNEPVYSGRNLGSPGFGGPGGIFTYPSSTANSHHPNGIYGQIGQYRSSSQSSSQHVSFAMDHPTSPASVGSSSLGAATTVPSMTLLPHPNYSHQLSMEDQGIDLTQSPGRESPSSSSSTVSVGLKSNISGGSGSGSSATSAILTGSSSCRHSTTSTTSLDSGRASGTYDLHHQHGAGQRHGSTSSSSTTSTFHHPGGQMLLVQHQQQQRFSGQSYESCLRNSYHSSSSSLGSSGGKIDDIHRLNIGEMLSQGMPEHEILNAWLTDLGFEEYYDLFVQSGYDMHTITRMTPEDLTAIGIQKPNHRKKLKAEMALLQIPDGLPDFKPETLEEWLALLGLAEYSPSLRRQGYRTVEDVTQLTWEDLEDFGILRLGHQKKIMLAIKRVKDILAGKYVPMQMMQIDPMASPGDAHDPSHPTFHYRNAAATSSSSHYAIPPSIMRPVFFMPQQQAPPQSHYQHLQQQPQQQHHVQQQQQPIYYHYQQPTYRPDVVAIQVHRNRSSEDVRACQTGPAAPNAAGFAESGTLQQTFYKPGWRQRSYEDGDVTPVSEHSHHLLPQGQNVPGGGTLPRPRGTVKPRPVAKISAKTRADCCPDPSAHLHDDLKAVSISPPAQPLYGTLGKKNPPPAPPKRASSSSITGESDAAEPIYGRSAKSSPLPLPPPPPVSADSMSLLAYSDDSEDFPPPPAPITASDSYLQHGQHASSAAASVRERLDNILQRTGAGHWPARPHSQQSHYGVPNATTSRPNSTMSSMKMVSTRECSPSESIETSDTEPGSPAMEFRQRRNGSDASFKSTSSTESDSMPFANDNAGTIKQRSARAHPALAALTYSSSSVAAVLSPSLGRRVPTTSNTNTNINLGTSDVLNDIGNMLADLTDELDSMLEEESSSQPIRQKS
uniref:Caskin-1 n=1 Tax=Daphnia magna TaxID=35525 RepID=A0A0N8C2S3_9CRUS